MLKIFFICSLFVMTAAHAKISVKFGTVAPAGTPWADVLQQIQKRVQTDSKGGIEIKTAEC